MLSLIGKRQGRVEFVKKNLDHVVIGGIGDLGGGRGAEEKNLHVTRTVFKTFAAVSSIVSCNPYCIGRFSRGPVPNASKRQFGSANLGSPEPLSDKATQGFQSESCLGGWRCKGPSEEVDRRRRGWTASRKI